MDHRAAREHPVDVLADAHRVVDAEQIERVLIGNEEQVRMVIEGDLRHSTGVKSNCRPAGA